jgi:enterochelin esterase-like enzyme
VERRSYLSGQLGAALAACRPGLVLLLTGLGSASAQEQLSALLPGDNETLVSPGLEVEGIRLHTVESRYQRGRTMVRVLLPDSLEAGRRYPVIYVLPVEVGDEHRYGSGLAEVQKHELHNKHAAIFVAPTFADLPWYADHPAKTDLRQETYLLRVVIPLVERFYPARADRQGRLLLGFSKSGWGAWSLLLRHPEVFERAAAWDAPLMMDRPGKYGSGPIFGTPDNFRHYQVSRLLEKVDRERHLGDARRLILWGHGNFQLEHDQIHQRMTDLKLPHTYRQGTVRRHDWHSGWVTEGVELLLAE